MLIMVHLETYIVAPSILHLRLPYDMQTHVHVHVGLFTCTVYLYMYVD